MGNIVEFLPIILPILLLHLALAIVCLVNLSKTKKVKIFNIYIWIFIILCVQILGSICYLLLGRVEE